MIYMDNGATSFPKPKEVIDSMVDVMTNYCANPGRAGHFLAARTAQEIYKTRIAAAYLFGIDNASRLVFTKNCTESINLALKGILREGDHVVTTSMEHNSVIRPLVELRKKGVTTTFVSCERDGSLDVDMVRQAIRKNTKMIVMTAASNVIGTKMPLKEVGKLAVRRGVLFMVDGAQGAGHMDLDVNDNNIDILAVPGHKGLMGPQGTGMLYVREGIEMAPLLFGGTGSHSKDEHQPMEFPEGYEAGTVNSPGIIGLGAAIKKINKIGVKAVEEHERRLTERLQKGLAAIDKVIIYGVEDTRRKTAVVSINIEGVDCETAAGILNDKYGIAVRAGFHCSPKAHETIGTGATGCIRICPGFYTSERDIDAVIDAVGDIASGKHIPRYL